MSSDDVKLEMDVKYDFTAYVNLDCDTDNTYENFVKIEEDIDWDPKVEFNSVLFNIDAQAFGDETLVDVSVIAIALNNEYSTFTASGVVIAV